MKMTLWSNGGQFQEVGTREGALLQALAWQKDDFFEGMKITLSSWDKNGEQKDEVLFDNFDEVKHASWIGMFRMARRWGRK